MTTKEHKYQHIISGKVYFTKQLDYLGVNKKYTGYFELVEIMNILINQMERRVVSFSREVYPIVAERFGVKDYTIERNLRNLIEKCWTKDLMYKLNIFKIDNYKPKCQDFIFIIKNYLEKTIM